MPELVFTSRLSTEHREDVERLVFFNGNQSRVAGAITAVMRRYGAPRLREIDARLWVTVDPHEPQTLFAVEREGDLEHVVGVAVYMREDTQLTVLFVAIDEEYTEHADAGDVGLLRRLVGELTAIARRTRGITALAIFFGRPEPTRIAIRRPTV